MRALTPMERFNINDVILYLGTGICHIDDIRTENFGTEPKEYFVMHAVSDPKSVIFVPVDSERLTSCMLELLSPNEINELIESAEGKELEWIPDNKQRMLKFSEIISSGNRLDILIIFKALSIMKRELEEQKKKFYATDERLLNAASKIVVEEFSFVLKIGPNDVVPYILDRVKNSAT